MIFSTDFGSPCPLAVRKGLRKYPLEYAKAVIQYLQQAQISFDSGPQASKIPCTLAFLLFALQFPSVIQTSSNLHTLVCQFRAKVLRLCKVLHISVQPYRYCYLLDQLTWAASAGLLGVSLLSVLLVFGFSLSILPSRFWPLWGLNRMFIHLDSALSILLGWLLKLHHRFSSWVFSCGPQLWTAKK